MSVVQFGAVELVMEMLIGSPQPGSPQSRSARPKVPMEKAQVGMSEVNGSLAAFL